MVVGGRKGGIKDGCWGIEISAEEDGWGIER